MQTLSHPHVHAISATLILPAIDDAQIDPLPVDPLARILAALIAEASLYIGQAAEPGRAHREVGAIVDRIVSGLHPGTGS